MPKMIAARSLARPERSSKSRSIRHRRHARTQIPPPGPRAPRQRAPARGDRRTNANDRAKSAKQRGCGNEVRIAHVDAVDFARDVVPHFVCEQNAQQRERKRDSQQQQLRMLEGQRPSATRILAAGKRLAILRVRLREFRAYSQRRKHRQRKKKQCRPKRRRFGGGGRNSVSAR